MQGSLIVLFVAAFLFANSAFAESPEEILNRRIPEYQKRYDSITPSLGRILLVDSKYLGGEPLSVAINREYPIIRKLPEEARAEFFFVIAIKTNLDAHPAEEFAEMVARDCPEAFARRVAQFLKDHIEGVPEPELRRAKMFASAVRELQQEH